MSQFNLIILGWKNHQKLISYLPQKSVAIPSVIFFPGQTIIEVLGVEKKMRIVHFINRIFTISKVIKEDPIDDDNSTSNDNNDDDDYNNSN